MVNRRSNLANSDCHFIKVNRSRFREKVVRWNAEHGSTGVSRRQLRLALSSLKGLHPKVAFQIGDVGFYQTMVANAGYPSP